MAWKAPDGEMTNPKYYPPNRLNVIPGDKFSKLTVLEEVVPIVYASGRQRVFRCMCECGHIGNYVLNRLASGNVKSCGCLTKRYFAYFRDKYGHYDVRIYKVYRSMMKRCYKVTDKSYCRYGARGIYVCDEWKNDFRNFYEWCLSNGFDAGLELDRENNNGIYEPSNCRFVTRDVNLKNRRDHPWKKWYDVKGEKITMKEGASRLGMSEWQIYRRMAVDKWSIEEAFTIGPYGKKKIAS